jgi:hypothetical protein
VIGNPRSVGRVVFLLVSSTFYDNGERKLTQIGQNPQSAAPLGEKLREILLA